MREENDSAAARHGPSLFDDGRRPRLNPTHPTETTASVTAAEVPAIAPTTTMTTTTATSSPHAISPSAPSEHPSMEEEQVIAVRRGYITLLRVAEWKEMDENEMYLFRGSVIDQTASYGLNLTDPFVITECTILTQELDVFDQAGGDNNITSPMTMSNNTISLRVTYLMTWTTGFGLTEVFDYPEYFLVHMNSANHSSMSVLSHKQQFIDIPDRAYITTIETTDVMDSATEIVPDEPATSPVPSGPAAMVAVKPTAMVYTSPSSEMPSAMPSNISPGSGAEFSADSANKNAGHSHKIGHARIGIPENERRGIMLGILLCFVVIFVSTAISVSYRRLRRRRLDMRSEIPNPSDDGTEQPQSGSSFLGGATSRKDRSRPAIEEVNKRSVNNCGKSDAPVVIPVDQKDVEMGIIIATTATSETIPNDPSISSLGSSRMKQFASTVATTGTVFPTGRVSTRMAGLTTADGGSNERAKEATAEPSTPRQEGSTVDHSSSLVGADLSVRRRSRRKSLGSDEEEGSFDGSLSSHDASLGVTDDNDEFNRYRNWRLETLRQEVESAVDDVEGMLSMAIARILFADAESLRTSRFDSERWTGGEDLGSIEASCLCRAFECARMDESFTGQTFFEEMVNSIVFIVHRGWIRPHDGARILHSCASIIGMPLSKGMPTNALAITGLIKSNDAARGHHLLVEAFGPFGDIVDASIAPINRGFGFVRFAKSESVAAVWKKHHASEIEIQDVALSINPI